MRIIGIHSVPRSGSTWLGSIFDSCQNTRYLFQPFFSYEFKDRINSSSSFREIEEYFEELYNTDNAFILQTEAKKTGLVPEFSKVNNPSVLAYKSVRYHDYIDLFLSSNINARFILLIRDPRAVIASWHSAPREFRKDLGWNLEEEWRYAPSKNQGRPSEYFGFEKWVIFTKLAEKLQDEYPSQVKIIKYTDLLHDRDKTISALFKFLDLKLEKQTIDFIGKHHQFSDLRTYSVYKSRTADDTWRDSLAPSIAEEIEKLVINFKLERYLI